jgi:Domain of unknown function (DUF4397)
MESTIVEGDATVKLERTLALLVSKLFLGLGIIGIVVCAALSGIQRHSASAASPSFVRIIHASPFVGTADVFVDGAKLLSSFQFGAVTDYVTLPAGPHKVQIALVGKGINASVISETLSVNPGVVYTVAAIGAQANNLSLEVFIDSNLLSAGTAKLRVYQLSPDGGSIAVSTQGKTVLSGLSYQNASNYLVLPVGGYTLDVDSPTNNTTLPVSVTLNANTVTSVFAVGLINGNPKIQLVSSQVQGVPGVPDTGSNPNAFSQQNGVQPLAPWAWPLAGAALLLLGSGVFLRRLRGVK